MKQELIKKAFKLGNSAGVLLPIEWINKKVSVKLVEESISQDIFEILEKSNLLKNTIGIFLAGSYARGEETELSDIDVLILTDEINKQVKIGKYEIIFISQDKFEKSILKNVYLASLINEAKAILNSSLLEIYKDKIGKVQINKNILEMESIIRINQKAIEIDEELGEKVLDETLYSLILRLREIYLIGCLKNKKIPSNKEFLNLIRRVASEESYNAYIRIKNDLKSKKVIPVEEAKSLIEEIKRGIERLKHGK